MDYPPDLTFKEIVQILCMPLFPLYFAAKDTYRWGCEKILEAKANSLAKYKFADSKIRGYYDHYFYWTNDDNICFIVHVKPLCRIERQSDINELMWKLRMDGRSFVLAHVDTIAEINADLIQQLNKSVSGIDMNTIIICHWIYKDIFSASFGNGIIADEFPNIIRSYVVEDC
jgi:hypothetical protein